MSFLLSGHLFSNSSSGKLCFVSGAQLNWYSSGRGAWSPRQSQGPCLSCLEFSSLHVSWSICKHSSAWFFGLHWYAPPCRWVFSKVEHIRWSRECWDDKNVNWALLIFSYTHWPGALSQPRVRWPPAPVVHEGPQEGWGEGQDPSSGVGSAEPHFFHLKTCCDGSCVCAQLRELLPYIILF